MARMIPSDGPSDTDSAAERDLYPVLKEQLPDEFVVVHGLPWLTTLTCRGQDSRGAKLLGPPTGEIDFLILHAELGVLAIEVKGGRYAIRDNRFIRLTGKPVPVVQQVRRNIHGFANQFDPALEMRARIGYAIAFPDASFDRQSLPPSLRGSRGGEDDIVILMDDIAHIGERVQKIMSQWVTRIGKGALGEQRLNQIVDLVSPCDDGEPTWSARIYGRDELWLRLTDEQLDCLNRIEKAPRQVVLGWPGTGKTVLAVETAKRASRDGRTTLFLTFNKLIGTHIKQQLVQVPGCQAYYFHELLREIRQLIERGAADQTDEEGLSQAADQGFFSKWDTLIVDEGQALAESWHRVLATAFSGKRVYVFCDDAQRFNFEAGASSISICEAYRTPPPFQLTHCLRNPFQINQLLQDLIPPAFQLVCQRPKELDVLTELIAGDLGRELSTQLDALLREAIAPEDITVLHVYDRPSAIDGVLGVERFRGVRCASVAAFRGMESRVVILVVDRRLSSELPIFSAYSRTTSRCVAIYAYDVLRDALRRGEGGTSRHTLLLARRSREVLREMADDLARESYFRTFQGAQKLEISSAHVYWHHRWRCWLVEARENEPAGFFWADHLCQYPWRVVVKAREARYPYVYEGSQPLNGDSKGTGELTYSICDECCMETGCSYGTGCLDCASRQQPEVDASLLEALCSLDERLMRLVDGEGKREGPEELPISLVALGMARLAVARNVVYVGTLLVNGGTPGYSAASTILRAYIALSGGRQIDRNEFAKRFFRYVEYVPVSLSFQEWKKIVASAFNIAVQHKVVDRIGKTEHYKIREPSGGPAGTLDSGSSEGDGQHPN
ncbi:AAA family ATPase [Ralstonia pseudosolanacearum]|uniref:nuclease-related domain-containing DEAD/DEAH box helicase n=1 Tax=Ralstonia pseudosolanacearum TaxID=1310165 RepID=UPI003CFB8A1B